VAGVRKQVESTLLCGGMDEVAAADCGLCVNEALANIIRHAYRGRTDRPIELTLELADVADGLEARMQVRDWGSGADPTKSLAHPSDPSTPGGVGLLCLRKLMDQVEFSPQGDGMLLTMVRRAPRRGLASFRGSRR
jgi:serine/threonine-protein kinase RsbW